MQGPQHKDVATRVNSARVITAIKRDNALLREALHELLLLATDEVLKSREADLAYRVVEIAGRRLAVKWSSHSQDTETVE